MQEIVCKHGKFFIIENDSIISESLKLYGEWCEEEMILIKDLIENDFNIIEVGSHIGSFSIPLCKSAPNGKVFLFEPQYFVFELLVKNLDLNKIKNYEARRCAISSTNTTVKTKIIDYRNLKEKINSGGYSHKYLIDSSGGGFDLSVFSLDSIFNNTVINFIKIDAEGNELDILNGSKNILINHKPMIYWEFEPSNPNQTKKILRFLNLFNYTSYKHKTQFYRENNYNKVKNNIFKNIYSFMILSVHNYSINQIMKLKLTKNNCQYINPIKFIID